MIYTKIKNDQKNSMKDKSLPKEFIKVVVSEFDRVGKDLTDAQCLGELTRLKKTAVIMNSVEEAKYLDKYLPTLMTRAEIETHVNTCIFNGSKTLGEIMKTFNTELKGLADNKLVSQIAKNLLKN